MIDLVTDLVGEWVEPASYDTRRATNGIESGWSVGDPVLVRAAFVGENGEPKLIVESSGGDRPGSLFVLHIDKRWVRPVVKCAKCGKWGHRQHDQLSPLKGTPALHVRVPAVMLIPQGDATFSPCGRYRYRLTRELGSAKTGSCVFIMLNPSTADGSKDDPTIRRCKGFASSWGYRHLVIVNLFAFRATDPRDMWRAYDAGVDIVGPDNDATIVRAVCDAVEIFCAWGKGGDKKRSAIVAERARSLYALFPRPVWCLDKNQDGSPKHPLYVAADVSAQIWSAYQ